MTRLILHAPGVHTGGGLVLLQNLLSVPALPLALANLDARALAHLPLRPDMTIHAVKPSAAARLQAEVSLARASTPESVVLCFHGMPPLLKPRGRVVVFLQNRNYLGLEPASAFDGRTRFRLPLERFLCRFFKGNVDEYIVQTPYMARATHAWHGGEPRIRVIPFLDGGPAAKPTGRKHDFIYVADGEAHKNHRGLLEAWKLLAAERLRPSLALTLEARFGNLLGEIARAVRAQSLRIDNLGLLPRDRLEQAYRESGALVFPSTSESFGLPLVEASRHGLPIIASELDYVRDVCDPVQTFDPHSPTSIARAVRRFMAVPEPRPAVRSGSDFIHELLN